MLPSGRRLNLSLLQSLQHQFVCLANYFHSFLDRMFQNSTNTSPLLMLIDIWWKAEYIDKTGSKSSQESASEGIIFNHWFLFSCTVVCCLIANGYPASAVGGLVIGMVSSLDSADQALHFVLCFHWESFWSDSFSNKGTVINRDHQHFILSVKEL